MRTICDLKGPDFLRYVNRARHAVQDLLRDTEVLEIRKHKPDFTGNETEEERRAMLDVQAGKNLSGMLDRLCEEKPNETYKVLRLFIIPDEDEEPDGIDILSAGMQLVSDKRVVDFFTSLARLEQTSTGG